MPELPEVEVTRRSLADRIIGGKIVGVRMGKPLRWPLGEDPEVLKGLKVEAVRRRGKYLLLDLSEKWLLLLHLGMSGSLQLVDSSAPPGVHDHFDLELSNGLLRLHDPRRFGAVVLTRGDQSERALGLLGKLGFEPLGDDFTTPAFHDALKSRRASIKQVLLAGDVVVGVGNIYASEALFMAGIRPSVSASRIGKRRTEKLRSAIRDVLGRAIASGGSTLRDFSNTDGTIGHFQNGLMVYGRAGQACRQCGNPVRLIRQGQRSTFFCDACQRR
jgi:formamidopyrimidine-DNA glycosylase